MSPIRKSMDHEKAKKRGCYTDELYVIHGYFRETIKNFAKLVERADPHDTKRIAFVADHIEEVGQMLIDHHIHEDTVI